MQQPLASPSAAALAEALRLFEHPARPGHMRPHYTPRIRRTLMHALEHPEALASSYWGAAQFAASATETWKTVPNVGHVLTLVAADGMGRALARAQLEIDGSRAIHITQLYVDADGAEYVRLRGLGRRMLARALEAAAGRLGLGPETPVDLEPVPGRNAAYVIGGEEERFRRLVAYYERLGFRLVTEPGDPDPEMRSTLGAVMDGIRNEDRRSMVLCASSLTTETPFAPASGPEPRDPSAAARGRPPATRGRAGSPRPRGCGPVGWA